MQIDNETVFFDPQTMPHSIQNTTAVHNLELSDIEFSKKTFVVTVSDQEEEYWPFIEFGAEGFVKEAFCTCAEQERLEEANGEENALPSYCPHITFALTYLTAGHPGRLSFQFENHFWHHLFYQVAQDDRYTLSYEVLENAPSLLATLHAPWGEIKMRVEDPKLQDHVKLLLDEKLVYEPSSLRFSTLSAQELNLWRLGRPTAPVRYQLSSCSELAKTLFVHQWRAKKNNSVPASIDVSIDTHYRSCTQDRPVGTENGASEQMVHLKIVLPEIYEMEMTLARSFFLPILPVLASLKEGIVGSFTPLECLKSLKIEGDKIALIYDEKAFEQAQQLFLSVDAPLCEGSFWYAVEPGNSRLDTGIYYLDSSPDQWPKFLDIADFVHLVDARACPQHHLDAPPPFSASHNLLNTQQSTSPLAFDPEPKQLKYQLKIDDEGVLHIEPYLLNAGDLKDVYDTQLNSDGAEVSETALILGDWVYLPQKGLLRIVQPQDLPRVVEKHQMPTFIEGHRAFLNQFPGFICWTHGLDFKMDYSVSCEGLSFFSPLLGEVNTIRSYGHWIYVPSKGFFLDHAQVKEFQGVYHGMQVPYKDVECFLDHNQTSTQNIPCFWAKQSPILDCFVQATLCDKEPRITFELKEELKAPFKKRKRQSFGRYDHVEGEGFWQFLPQERPPKEILEISSLSQDDIAPWLLKVKQPRSLERKSLGKLPQFLQPLECSMVEILDARHLEEHIHKEFEDFYGRVYLVKISLALTGIKNLNFEQITKSRLIDKRYLLTQEGMIDLEDRLWRWLQTSLKAIDKIKTIDPSFLEALNSTLEPTSTPKVKKGATWAFVDVLTLFKWNLRKQLKIDPDLQVVQHLEKDLQLLMGQEIPMPDISQLKSVLRPYQQLGVKWLWQLYRLGLGGLLCDDMGLGKTHQVMALMAAIWSSGGRNRTFFIACPTSVVFHWQTQLSRFLPAVPHVLYHGGSRELPSQFEGIILTTYGVCRLDIADLEKRHFALAIYDEVQLAKNAQSRIYKSLERIQAQIRVGLSGTPVENSLKDLKSLMDLAVAGWMPPQKQFEEEYLVPLERFGDRSIVTKIKSHVHPFVLRREKSEVLDDLPEKVIQTHICALSDDQKAIYQSVLQQARGSLRDRIGGADRGIPYLHIFSALNSLKQICNHPAVYFRNRGQTAQRHEYDCDKWDLFCYLLSEALASGQKVVVFSQYLAMLDLIEEYLHAHNIGYTSVRGNTRQRGERVEKFQTDPDCRVFVASLHAAGVGIDLTAGSVVILYDRWWNAAKENQAIDRVHRIGQSKGVQVIRLIVQGTIEEKIDAIIERKAKLMKEAVVTDDHRFLKSLSEDEILALLDFNHEET